MPSMAGSHVIVDFVLFLVGDTNFYVSNEKKYDLTKKTYWFLRSKLEVVGWVGVLGPSSFSWSLDMTGVGAFRVDAK